MESRNTVRFALFQRHGELARSLIHNFGPSLLYRLRVDPVSRPDDDNNCAVDVCSIDRLGDGTEKALALTIDWADATELEIDDPALCAALPEQAITEKAAIGMMALLVLKQA